MGKKRDPTITSRIMANIHSKNTKPELLLAQELRKAKIPFKKQYDITGKPDFVIPEKKIAIFCDGDFWHGNNWKVRKHTSRYAEFKTNREFWVNKIRKNIQRDKWVNKKLQSEGWVVLRFWENQIKKDPPLCVERITNCIK